MTKHTQTNNDNRRKAPKPAPKEPRKPKGSYWASVTNGAMPRLIR